ncbi:MAG: glutamate racemase [candidate division Zixibacteria bacterium SM23_73_3]|nr:MAG: glutamate racemase [candidate division Zixibacteria bacterium SM23_73_3]
MPYSPKSSAKPKENANPLGIFDSGVGGLTVAKKIFELLPNENVIYFGDTGRYPYGPRSKGIVKKFSSQNVNFLLSYKVKFIVVACNTASSFALAGLRKNYDIPLVGVIEPGAAAAIKATRNGKIGVIGTVGTIYSKAYQKAIHRRNRQMKVYSIPCPLFVSLAEEGYINKDATQLIANEYLNPLVKKQVDTLVLGCTHYPLLKKVISRTMGEKVKLIDSAEETAKEVKRLLKIYGLLRNAKGQAFRRFYVSDVPNKFIEVGEKFLKGKIRDVKRIDIDKH